MSLCSIEISRVLWYWLFEGPASNTDDNARIPSKTKLKEESGLAIAIFNTKYAKDSSSMGANIRALVSWTIPLELGSLVPQEAVNYSQYVSRYASSPESENGERCSERGIANPCKYSAIKNTLKTCLQLYSS